MQHILFHNQKKKKILIYVYIELFILVIIYIIHNNKRYITSMIITQWLFQFPN